MRKFIKYPSRLFNFTLAAILTLQCVFTALLAGTTHDPSITYGPDSSGIIRVRLTDALGDGIDLSLRFTKEKGLLEDKVYGFAMFWNDLGIGERSFNYRIHKGRILNYKQTTEGLKINLSMKIESDPWVKGGPAEFELLLNIDEQAVTGTHSVSFNRITNNKPYVGSGTLSGTLGAPISHHISEHVPFAAEEHPRILLRKADVPRLQKLIKETPEGRRIFERMEARAEMLQGLQRAHAWRMLNYSSMYLATGNKKWADKTKEAVIAEMKAPLTASKMLWRAPRFAMVAIAYDNCYDAWEKDFRLEVTQWLEYRISTLERGGGNGYNSAPHSNWQAITKGSLGTIGMALLNDPGKFQAPPVPTAPTLPKGTPAELPEGATATLLTSGSGLTDWLVASSFEGVKDIDRLESEGGRGGIRPEAGDSVRFGGETISFSKIDPKFVSELRNGGVTINCVGVSDKRPNNTTYYFKWVKVTEEQYLKALIDHWRTSIWIGGQRVNKGEVVHLEPGHYPLLMEVSIGQPTGRLGLKFEAIDGTEAKATHQKKYEVYLAAQKAWDDAHEAWLADGGKVQSAEMAIEMGRIGIEDYLTSSLGDRGYPMEGDGYLAFPITVALSFYLQGAEHAMGISYQETTGIGDVLALQLWQTIGDMKINYGPPGWQVIDDSGEERTGTWPVLLGMTKEKYLPALKTYYDRTMGLKSEQPSFGISHSTQGIFALMNYPWDVEAKPIDEAMEPIYYDRHMGHLIARREWTDRNDHVAVIHILERPRGSVHLAEPYPEYSFYAEGEKVLSTRVPDAGFMKSPSGFIGGRTISFTDLGGGSFIHGTDLSSKYIQMPTKKQRKSREAIDSSPQAQVTRYNAVIFADEETTIYALLDQEKDGQLIRTNFSTVYAAHVENEAFIIEINEQTSLKGLAIALNGELAVQSNGWAKLGAGPQVNSNSKGQQEKAYKGASLGLSVASNGGHLIVATTGNEIPVRSGNGIRVGSRFFKIVDGALVVE